MQQRALGLTRNVNLSFFETLNEIIGSEIDQFDGIGAVENRIRYGFTNADVGDLCNNFIQAVDVLNVHGGVDVDASAQQLFDVEVPLRMPTALRIGMSEFIDQNDLRSPSDDGVEVHLVQELTLVLNALTRNDPQAVQQRLCFLAAVSFDNTHYNVTAIR